MDSITLPMQYVTGQLKVRSLCVCEDVTFKLDRPVMKVVAP